TSTTCARPSRPTRSGSGGSGPERREDRSDRVHGGRQDDRGAVARRGRGRRRRGDRVATRPPGPGDLRPRRRGSVSRDRGAYDAVADVIVPASCSRDLTPVLAALEGVPAAGVRVLWATSPSGDYPVYLGPGLLEQHRFWPAPLAGRKICVTDYSAGRLYGEA